MSVIKKNWQTRIHTMVAYGYHSKFAKDLMKNLSNEEIFNENVKQKINYT